MLKKDDIFVPEVLLSKDKKKEYKKRYETIMDMLELTRENKDITYMTGMLLEQLAEDPGIDKLKLSIDKIHETYGKGSRLSDILIEEGLVENIIVSFGENEFTDSMMIVRIIRNKRKRLHDFVKEEMND